MYYTVVLITAIIIEVVLLVIIGTGLKKKDKVVYPDFQNICPDFWKTEGTICKPNGVNTPGPAKFDKLVRHDGVTTMDTPNDLSHPHIIQTLDTNPKNWSDVCDKFNWANTNGVYWDGVSNTNQCTGGKLPGQV